MSYFFCSKEIDFVEWGYNRDKESLAQVNLGVIYGRTLDLPLFYSLYPGSIHVVSTLTNIVTELGVLTLDKTTFVLDKGFYSSVNLSRMAEVKHIVPLPVRINKGKEFVENQKSNIRSSSYEFTCNKQVTFCVEDSITITGTHYRACIYLNEKKQVEQREKFLKATIECEQYVASQGFNLRKDFDDFFNESKPFLIPYFGLKKKGPGNILVRNDAEIDKALSVTGMFVPVTNTGLGGPEVLQLYREKDGVEKSFDLLKHNLVLRRLRVHSQSALEGLLFMEFNSLILYAYMVKKLRERFE